MKRGQAETWHLIAHTLDAAANQLREKPEMDAEKFLRDLAMELRLDALTRGDR